jgi:hypothetical protein
MNTEHISLGPEMQSFRALREQLQRTAGLGDKTAAPKDSMGGHTVSMPGSTPDAGAGIIHPDNNSKGGAVTGSGSDTVHLAGGENAPKPPVHPLISTKNAVARENLSVSEQIRAILAKSAAPAKEEPVKSAAPAKEEPGSAESVKAAGDDQFEISIDVLAKIASAAFLTESSAAAVLNNLGEIYGQEIAGEITAGLQKHAEDQALAQARLAGSAYVDEVMQKAAYIHQAQELQKQAAFAAHTAPVNPYMMGQQAAIEAMQKRAAVEWALRFQPNMRKFAQDMMAGMPGDQAAVESGLIDPNVAAEENLSLEDLAAIAQALVEQGQLAPEEFEVIAQVLMQAAQQQQGGMPPMDPAMMGGGMPPMDPAMMGGGMPPMDPAMMGGGMPPMDPAMMGGMPPVMASAPYGYPQYTYQQPAAIPPGYALVPISQAAQQPVAQPQQKQAQAPAIQIDWNAVLPKVTNHQGK